MYKTLLSLGRGTVAVQQFADARENSGQKIRV